MTEDIVQLPIRFEKNGFLYWQICRTDIAAIYEQKAISGNSIYYEVWVIRSRPQRIFGGKVLPACERSPSNEDWGTYGWTFYDLPSARKRYDLVNSRVKHPYSNISPEKLKAITPFTFVNN